MERSGPWNNSKSVPEQAALASCWLGWWMGGRLADWLSAWITGRDVSPASWLFDVGGRLSAPGLGVPRAFGSKFVWSSMLSMWLVASVSLAAQHSSIGEVVTISLQILWPLRGLCRMREPTKGYKVPRTLVFLWCVCPQPSQISLFLFHVLDF